MAHSSVFVDRPLELGGRETEVGGFAKPSKPGEVLGPTGRNKVIRACFLRGVGAKLGGLNAAPFPLTHFSFRASDVLHNPIQIVEHGTGAVSDGRKRVVGDRDG